MLGQFRVEPDPELEPEFEDEPDEPLLVLLDPELLVLDDGVVVEELEVEEPELEFEPVVPELPVFDVVAALAASAPPARRPDVSAPTAKTLRKRICMSGCPFVCCVVRSVRAGTAHDVPATCGVPQSDRSASVEFVDDPMTIHRRLRSASTADATSPHMRANDDAQVQRLVARQQYERIGTSTVSAPANWGWASRYRRMDSRCLFRAASSMVMMAL